MRGLFRYRSLSISCSNFAERKRVTIVEKNVMKERTKGNMGFFIFHKDALAKVPGISIILEVMKTIKSRRILPIKPATKVPSVLSATSLKSIFRGPAII